MAVIDGDNANNTIFGTADEDMISGRGGNNSLFGLGRNDTLNGGPGADALDGGIGIDVAFYGFAAAGVYADLLTGLNTGEAAGDTYTSIEGIEGSNFDDSLRGNDGANTLRGFSGDDFLYGWGGNDTLNGESGADALYGGDGIDLASYDFATAGVAADLLSPPANAGEAAGDAYFSIENILGSLYDDTLRGNDGANALGGGHGGNDVLWGRGGSDVLAGGVGNDELNGGLAGDALDGGSGIDLASYESAAAGVVADLHTGFNAGEAVGDTYTSIENILGSFYGDTLRGNDFANALGGGSGGKDSLHGRGGADLLAGGNFDDTLNGGLAGDALDGGSGRDVASYQGADASVTADLRSPGANNGEAAGDTYTSIENIRGSAFIDVLAGNDGANTLWGGAGGGNDFLFGRGGDDELNGGLGADWLDGGSGIDLASYESATAGVRAYLWAAGSNGGEAAGDTYTSIENILGSAFGDWLDGDEGANALGGGTGGDDILEGGAGNDLLAGGNGDDTLDGGTGGDAFDGGSGVDTVDYFDALGVTASLQSPGSNTGEAAGDTYTAIENILGSLFRDTLRGNDGANQLVGYDGDDTLVGRGGNDVLVGNHDNDVLAGDDGDDKLNGGLEGDALDGGSGTDVASYEHAATGVTASLATPGSNAGEAAGDSYAFIENILGSRWGDALIGDENANALGGGTGGDDTLDGRGGDDVLAGGGGNDVLAAGIGDDILNGGLDADSLSGQDGSDRLFGGLGRDILSGGAGNDVFDFNSVAESGITGATRDIVSDFVRGSDEIDLATIDASTAAGNQAFTFVGAAAFTGEGQIRAFQSGANTILEVNTVGPGAAEMTLQLANITATLLTSADFVL